MVNGEPYFLEKNNKIFPTIWFLDKFSMDIPKVVINLGAVMRVSKGADVMIPGITHINKNIKEGDIVVVVDEKHERVIAVGLALMSSDKIKESEKGRAIRNIHHVGDKLWKTVNEILKS
jgi:PUA domain protein